MRFLLFLIAAVLALGCSKSQSVSSGKPIGEPPGYRFPTKSDAVGTVIYERGVQWIGSDHEPTKLGVLTQTEHVAETGLYKGKSVVSYRIEGLEETTDALAELFYNGGTYFVKTRD